MAHVNTQLRNAVKALLEDAEIRPVYTNRSADLQYADLPCAVVQTGEDTVEQVSKDGLEERTIPLVVVLVADVISQADVDDEMDALRAIAETAITGSTLGGIAHSVEHTGGELDTGTDEEGEHWYAFYALSWTVRAFTRHGAPETAV